jgi:hypothetical protein
MLVALAVEGVVGSSGNGSHGYNWEWRREREHCGVGESTVVRRKI